MHIFPPRFMRTAGDECLGWFARLNGEVDPSIGGNLKNKDAGDTQAGAGITSSEMLKANRPAAAHGGSLLCSAQPRCSGRDGGST